MSFTFSLHPEANLLVLRAEGVVRDEDVFDGLEAAYSHPDFREGMLLLTDARFIDTLSVTRKGIRRMVSITRRLRKEAFRAAVVTTSPVVHGVARMYDMIGGDTVAETRVFKTLEDALEWLGVPDFEPEAGDAGSSPT